MAVKSVLDGFTNVAQAVFCATQFAILCGAAENNFELQRS
jgi:hypothetical protein